jgi:hypothetical protein
MDVAKKASERRILTRFLSNQSLKVKAAGVRDMDPPDFSFDLFENNKFKEVSVELTRVFNPSLKQKEAAQDRIVDTAWNLFKSQRDEHLVVYVVFTRETIPFDNLSMGGIASELFKFVHQIAERNQGCEFRVETKNTRPFNKWIDTITVSNDQGFDNWQSFGAFRVPHVEESWFVNLVANKEAKIKNYPKQFDRKWIILVSNFGHESSAFQFNSLKLSFESSLFDKIFLYQYFSDEVIVFK